MVISLVCSMKWFRSHYQRLCLSISARVFKPYRADYYAYLSEMIGLNGGGKTLLKILEADAKRYRGRGARGLLANYWANRLTLASGDVYSTFDQTLPQDDIVALRTAQLAGGQSLSLVFGSLGRCVRTYDEAKNSFLQTTSVGFSAWLVALLSIMAMPFFTHDRLFMAFSMVPSEYYGPWTIRFDQLSQLLRSYWCHALVVSSICLGFTGWSVENYVGPFRSVLDRWFIWKLYRSLQAMRFLSLLAVLIQPQGSELARLRHALVVMSDNRCAWLDHHLQTMLSRIDVGLGSVQALDSGLIDEKTWWFLCDVAEIAGLDQAIFRSADRLGTNALNEFKQSAQQIRWSLLILAVIVVMGIALVHVKVIDELRQAMAIAYAFN